ncbi:unnamed protein product, partial [Rotaria sp. Silwood1]
MGCSIFMGTIVLWSGVIINMAKEKVTTNVEAYFAMVHMALMKTLGILWGFSADDEVLSDDGKRAFRMGRYAMEDLIPRVAMQNLESFGIDALFGQDSRLQSRQSDLDV